MGEPPLSLGSLHLKSMQEAELSIISTGPSGGVGLSEVKTEKKDNKRQKSKRTALLHFFLNILNCLRLSVVIDKVQWTSHT